MYNNNAGQVRIFRFDTNSNNWLQMGEDLDSATSFSQFGHSISLSADGSLIGIGAHPNHVQVYRFDVDSNDWIQMGKTLNGQADYDQFGWSVSLSPDGSTLAVGAIYNDESALNSGSVQVFSISGKFINTIIITK